MLSLTTGTTKSPLLTPVAEAFPTPTAAVVGSVIQVDGRRSSGEGSLTYRWRFLDPLPIGSRVAEEGFRVLELDGSVVSFSPDVAGEYRVGLVVGDGFTESPEVTVSVPVKVILVPHGRGVVPDGKFIWQYLRDAWADVEGREMFETLWSVITQTAGGELLKLYQTDYSKSIKDIQALYQRRWLKYEPKLELDSTDVSFFLGGQAAGMDGITGPIGYTGRGILVSSTEILVTEGSTLPSPSGVQLQVLFSSTGSNTGLRNIAKANAKKTGYILSSVLASYADDRVVKVGFTFKAASKTWSFVEPEVGPAWDIRVGDVVNIDSGANAGLYRVLTHTAGTFPTPLGEVTVDRTPPEASAGELSYCYHPVGIKVYPTSVSLTGSIGVPTSADLSSTAKGRVITACGQAFTLLRTGNDPYQRVPMTVATMDQDALPAGLNGQAWRIPHTLVSKTLNFRELGVSPGDVLVFDVESHSLDKIVQIPVQVVGVDRSRIGFVLTDEDLVPGVVPAIPNWVYTTLADAFAVQTVTQNADGTLTFSGTAQSMKTEIESIAFARTYLNTEITESTDLVVGGIAFQLRPRFIIRNSLLPLDASVRSIPVLQQFILQPDMVVENGVVYQVKDGVKYPIPATPQTLFENLDYVVDREVAFSGPLSFQTGTDVLSTRGGDFVDRGIVPGDSFVIDAPSPAAGTYRILRVVDSETLLLGSEIPAQVTPVVRAQVRVLRGSTGCFVRFTPNRFTPKAMNCDRMWAEVTFFDNGEVIENNFGLSVGLKRDDLTDPTNTSMYRQAVAGLMYAYSRGSAIDTVRLGVQILLGLPYSEHRGVIRSIEKDYRVDHTGTPTMGRMLVEDIDTAGTTLGVLRVYTFPLDPVSPLSGVDTNPATGREYAVGDTVEIFSALCKGVEVLDEVLSPLGGGYSVMRRLQQFHSVRVRFNDYLFDAGEISLVSKFLSRITPSYIEWFLSAAVDLQDIIKETDRLKVRTQVRILDNASLCLPIMLGVGDHSPVSATPHVFVDGGFYRVLREGQDLVVTAAETFTVTAAGLLNPRTGESFDSGLCKTTDYLYIPAGVNAGTYPLATVTDGGGTITSSDLEASAAGIPYAVLRKVSPLLRISDTAVVVSGNSTVTLNPGLRNDGVAPGHWLLLNGQRFTITRVKKQSTTWNQVEVTPTPNFSGTFSTGTNIVNPKLITTEFPITFTATGIGSTVVAVPLRIRALLDPMDEIYIASLGRSFTVYNPQYSSTQIALSETLAAGSYSAVIRKPRRPDGLGWDLVEKQDPEDGISMVMSTAGSTATCTAASNAVDISVPNNVSAMELVTGDYLIFTSGANSTVDIGLGAGVFLVEYTDYQEIGPVNRIYTTRTVTQSGAAAWKIERRR